jgi:NAD(P) transhydrogenase
MCQIGKSVLVVEKGHRVGGVSVHSGTIPSKTLRETVLNLTGYRERGFYGRAYRVKQDIGAKDLSARLQMTLTHEVDVLEHQFARNGVKAVCGAARFLDPHTLEITTPEGERHVVRGSRIVIAVGTRPHRPDDIPFNGTSVFDSDDMIDTIRLPRSLTVIGAGVIGVEYATIYSALDVAVTLVEPRDSFLDFVDHELIEDFTHQLRDRGVTLRLGSKVERIEFDGAYPVAVLADGRRARSEMLLFTGGREGVTDLLNLEACGLVADARGRLKIDPHTFQTDVRIFMPPVM